MIADSVPPASRPIVYRRTLVVFAFVLCAHAAIAWWLLGAKFSYDPIAPEEPLFVMVVADGVDDPGGATPNGEGALSDQAEHATPAPVAPQSEPAPVVPASIESSSRSASADATAEPVAIAVDKSVQNPVNNSVDKPDVPLVAQTPRAAPTSRKEPVRVKDLAAKSPTQLAPDPAMSMHTADANRVSGTQASAATTAEGNAALTTGGNHAGGVGAGSGPRRIVRPDYLNGPPTLSYPSSARNRRQQGKVIVRVVISPSGTPSSVDVLQTSGFDALDKAALDAVRRARFRPYAENGIALEALVDIPFDFVLRN